MRIEEITESTYKIFINKMMIDGVDFYSKKELENLLKKVILSLKKRGNINLKGSYDVEILLDETTGAFIDIRKNVSDFIEIRDVDLRIKIIFHHNFYFKTKYYELIQDKKPIYFYQGYFYIKTKMLDDLTKCIEMGELIYEAILEEEEEWVEIRK